MGKILTNQLNGGIGCAWDPKSGRVVVAEFGGTVVAVDDHGRHILGVGYGALEDIVLTADGRTAIVSERGGEILQVDMRAPNRTDARTITRGLAAPHQLALDERRSVIYVVEFGRQGRLLAVPLEAVSRFPTRPEVIATELVGAVGLVIDLAGTTAYVSEQVSGDGRVRAFSLRTGKARTLTTGLVSPFMMTWKDRSETSLLVAERDPADRITEVPTRHLTPPALAFHPTPVRPSAHPLPFRTNHRVFVDEVAFRPSSVLRVRNELYVVSDSVLEVFDLAAPAPELRVEFDIDKTPLFVGSWRRLGVSIVGSGASFDDLEFDVVEGARAGRISPSRDATFDPARPHVMLLAGYEPGAWTVRARHATTGDELGSATFETTTRWAGVDGPPKWIDGVTQPAVLGSTWGGGSTGPQNVDINEATGNRRVALLLVDTASQRYPADASPTADEWEGETFDGVDVGGKTTSVHHWFQEVSRGDFGLSKAGVFGPVSLAGDFEDYFSLTDDGIWAFESTFFQAAVTAADGLIDYTGVDSLVCIVQTAPAADSGSMDPELNTLRMAWPYAWGDTFTTADGTANLGVVVMPNDWESNDTRELYETLTHELCHNLGLGDLYMNDSFGALETRDVDGWDVMSKDNDWSHPTADNKLRLGWMEAAWIRAFDFTSSGAVDETITLRASEAGPPAAGEFSAIEVRVADGWNYYFEYRAEQAGQIGSQLLSPDRRVVGTDVVSPTFTAPVTRRSIILLPNDEDGDGPELAAGDDFKQLDTSTPSLPNDFQFDVVSIDGDTATVRLRYGVNSKPDPSIRPWPGTGTNAYQSPDIEVRNDRNAVEPDLVNLPWTGHPNTIVAKVTNRGTLPAQGVQVDFGVKDFTVGGGSEVPLGSAYIDIAAGATVEATFDGWVPPAGGHFCVTARMPLHVEAGPPTIVELTELNNMAQSNYTEFISAESSPPTRERAFVTVGNPYPERARVFIQPRQTNPFYRTYVGASMVVLGPGEERMVEFMVEALRGTGAAKDVFERYPELEEHVNLPNHVSLSAFVEDPLDGEVHVTLPMGGAVARVRTGTATRIVEAGADGDTVFGRILAADGTVITGGQVIASVREKGVPLSERTATGVVTEGHFAVQFDELVQDADLVGSVEYLGSGDWAPSPEARFEA